VLWRCWLGIRKSVRPVKEFEWWGASVVICLERGANDLHVVQLMPATATPSSLDSLESSLHGAHACFCWIVLFVWLLAWLLENWCVILCVICSLCHGSTLWSETVAQILWVTWVSLSWARNVLLCLFVMCNLVWTPFSLSFARCLLAAWFSSVFCKKAFWHNYRWFYYRLVHFLSTHVIKAGSDLVTDSSRLVMI